MEITSVYTDSDFFQQNLTILSLPGVVPKQEIERTAPEAAHVDGAGSVFRLLTQDARVPHEPVSGGPRGRPAGVSVLRDGRWQVRVWVWPAVPP